ncbi:MAG: hypothetical protein ACKVOR_13430 [Flavobacteriales bacterium]
MQYYLTNPLGLKRWLVILQIAIASMFFSTESICQSSDSVYTSKSYGNHSWFVAQWSSSYTLSKTPMACHGNQWTLGFNVARFFTQNASVSVVLDLKPNSGIFPGRHHQGFDEAFNRYLNFGVRSHADSARIEGLQDVISGGDFWQTYGKIGIFISPFASKFESIYLKATRGNCNYELLLDYPLDPSIVEFEDQDFIDFNVRNVFSLELGFAPVDLFNDKRISYEHWTRHIFLSCYWNRNELKTASVQSLGLREFLNPAFFSEYGTIDYFGFRIGIGIW